jgi:tRNA pseudouridine13 synthase
MRAVNDIARALGVLSRDIGLAGLKDARAVTRQMLSVEHVDPANIKALDIPRIKVLSVSRHGNKLKIGHLRGNRFQIKLRECNPVRLMDIRAVLDILQKRGVPNYFGPQRFGSRGDTWQLGRGILMKDSQSVIDLMLGKPTAHDTGDVLQARQLYDAANFGASAKAWPYGFRDNARACRVMEKTHGNHRRALYAVDQRLKKFFVSAYQSHLFNHLLAERIGEIDKLMEGDLAYKHENGAVFRVEDAAAEGPRAAAFEVSPTGPIFGYRMTEAAGEPGRLEQEILAAEGISLDDFRFIKGMKVHGARRPLRFQLADLAVDAGADDHGPYVELAFTLSSGCYATMVLREICKEAMSEGLDESDS